MAAPVPVWPTGACPAWALTRHGETPAQSGRPALDARPGLRAPGPSLPRAQPCGATGAQAGLCTGTRHCWAHRAPVQSPKPRARLCWGSSLVPKAGSEAVGEEAKKDVPRTWGGRLLRALPASKVHCACQRPPHRTAQASPGQRSSRSHPRTRRCWSRVPSTRTAQPLRSTTGSWGRSPEAGTVAACCGPPVVLTPLQSPPPRPARSGLCASSSLRGWRQEARTRAPGGPGLCPWPPVPRSAALGSPEEPCQSVKVGRQAQLPCCQDEGSR